MLSPQSISFLFALRKFVNVVKLIAHCVTHLNELTTNKFIELEAQRRRMRVVFGVSLALHGTHPGFRFNGRRFYRSKQSLLKELRRRDDGVAISLLS